MSEQWRDPFVVWAIQDARQLVPRAKAACVSSREIAAGRGPRRVQTAAGIDDDTRAQLRSILGLDE